MQTNSSTNINDLNSFKTDINQLDAFLNYKIFTIEGHSLTPGIIVLFAAIIVGVWLAIKILRRVIIGKRKEENDEFGRRFSLFMILKYIAYIIGFVLVLEVAGIGTKTFLVGSAALLVGVGLGLQYIFSDLISGLFLLFERPIEQGDVIEVDGLVGRIQQVKLRHTVITDRDGVNLIVPNHKFVTEKVINWSHQQDESRFQVTVGVAYGSDVNKVTELLKKAANDHPLIIKKDAMHPIMVRLSDFGESSLNFELHFWSRHTFIVENIKSELRYTIIELFNQEGIVIPFPQRDIHIQQGQVIS